VTVRRLEHARKQLSPSTSTDDGRRIDSNDKQKEKAHSPIDRRVESDSNATVLSFPFEEQQYGRTVSIDDGISIDSGDPITQISDRSSKSTKNSVITLNETDPPSTSIDLIPLSRKAAPSIAVTEAGMKSRVND
jgi:hypothetical protein